MGMVTLGIDLAKNVFALHGVDDNGKSVLVKPEVSRDALLLLIVQLPPGFIGMPACSGAYHWARQFRRHGHGVRLMAPKFDTSNWRAVVACGEDWSHCQGSAALRRAVPIRCGAWLNARQERL